MSVNTFIPEIWDDNVLRNKETRLVYGSPLVVNRNYEGDISRAGDTVNVSGIGDPTITDYVKNVPTAGPEVLQDFTTSLTIDQAKKYEFVVDDIDRIQALADFRAEATRRAGYGLAKVTDQHIAAIMAAAAAGSGNAPSGLALPGHVGTSTVPVPLENASTVTSTGAYEFLVDQAAELDSLDLGIDEEPFAIVPSWLFALLETNPFFVNTAGDGGPVLHQGIGAVGEVSGLQVVRSNNVPTGTFDASGGNYVSVSSTALLHEVLIGVPSATSYAGQLLESEAFRSHDIVGDVFRGLDVYGAAVIWPERLIKAYVAPGKTG